MANEFKRKIEYIVSVLLDAGYEPYDQLFAYLTTGSDSYITRKGNARALVTELDRKQLWSYIEPLIEKKSK